jgi:pSer/pThr/pTyr-binding forkhead associated (FHA) protein
MTDLELAQRLPRDAFVRERPCYFLFGMLRAERPYTPGRTLALEVVTAVGDGLLTSPALPALPFDDEIIELTPRLFAVRKQTTMFESMVTIGRTQNNDIVLFDTLVSRFHAFLKLHVDRVELGDAGSRNGTYVDGKRLGKEVHTILIPGDLIRFADLELEFLEAGVAWDRVQALKLRAADQQRERLADRR